MKPRNRFYGYSPTDYDEGLMIKCTYCGVHWHSSSWRANNGLCPGCQKAYAGEKSED